MSIWSSAKIKPREPERLKAEPFDFTMWMQDELLSGTKLIPEYKSFRYRITAPKKQALPSFAFNCSRCFKDGCLYNGSNAEEEHSKQPPFL